MGEQKERCSYLSHVLLVGLWVLGSVLHEWAGVAFENTRLSTDDGMVLLDTSLQMMVLVRVVVVYGWGNASAIDALRGGEGRDTHVWHLLDSGAYHQCSKSYACSRSPPATTA